MATVEKPKLAALLTVFAVGCTGRSATMRSSRAAGAEADHVAWVELGPGHVWTGDFVHVPVSGSQCTAECDEVSVDNGGVVIRITVHGEHGGDPAAMIRVPVGDIELPLLRSNGHCSLEVRRIGGRDRADSLSYERVELR